MKVKTKKSYFGGAPGYTPTMAIFLPKGFDLNLVLKETELPNEEFRIIKTSLNLPKKPRSWGKMQEDYSKLKNM